MQNLYLNVLLNSRQQSATTVAATTVAATSDALTGAAATGDAAISTAVTSDTATNFAGHIGHGDAGGGYDDILVHDSCAAIDLFGDVAVEVCHLNWDDLSLDLGPSKSKHEDSLRCSICNLLMLLFVMYMCVFGFICKL